MPVFNTTRMVREYLGKFYGPASRQWKRYSGSEFAAAKRLSEWKARVRAAWTGVALRRLDSSPRRISYGDSLRFEVAINLNGLSPADVTVEILFGRPGNGNVARKLQSLPLMFEERTIGHEHIFSLDLRPELCGRMEYRIRAYPNHELLTHALEMGMMRWL
jgi:starch phosphorylase